MYSSRSCYKCELHASPARWCWTKTPWYQSLCMGKGFQAEGNQNGYQTKVLFRTKSVSTMRSYTLTRTLPSCRWGRGCSQSCYSGAPWKGKGEGALLVLSFSIQSDGRFGSFFMSALLPPSLVKHDEHVVAACMMKLKGGRHWDERFLFHQSDARIRLIFYRYHRTKRRLCPRNHQW